MMMMMTIPLLIMIEGVVHFSRETLTMVPVARHLAHRHHQTQMVAMMMMILIHHPYMMD